MPPTSLAYRTDLMFHRFDGVVEERDTYTVVRSPNNPGYYWGNYLLFSQPPAPGDAPRWIEQFRSEMGVDPRIRHMALGWDGDDAGAAAELAALGMELRAHVVLATTRPAPPPRPAPGLTVRAIAGDDDWVQDAALVAAADPAIGSSPDYARFDQLRRDRYRAMTEAGRGRWLGAFDSDRLVAHLGIFADGEVARFQMVDTHPDYRGRGACMQLIAAGIDIGLGELGARTVIIVAEPGAQAERIYRRAGFTDAGTDHGAERAPASE